MLMIYWYPVKVRDMLSGEEFEAQPYGSTDPMRLLYRIKEMPRQKALRLQEAITMTSLEARRLFQFEGGYEAGTFINEWVSWITKQGFHIELTGEEFEMDELSERVSS